MWSHGSLGPRIDALKPATLKPTEKTDYVYLLMPVRVA